MVVAAVGVLELDATAVPSISGITQLVGVPAAVPLEAKALAPKGVVGATPPPVVAVVLPVYVYEALVPGAATTNNLKSTFPKVVLFITVAVCPVVITAAPEFA